MFLDKTFFPDKFALQRTYKKNAIHQKPDLKLKKNTTFSLVNGMGGIISSPCSVTIVHVRLMLVLTIERLIAMNLSVWSIERLIALKFNYTPLTYYALYILPQIGTASAQAHVSCSLKQMQ